METASAMDPHTPRFQGNPPSLPPSPPRTLNNSPSAMPRLQGPATRDNSPLLSSRMPLATPKPPVSRQRNIVTPRPQTDSASPTAGRAPDPGRQLNVTDALGYLDDVKNKFVERPDVYNKFLDIMKDFKSQVIDTPGVIMRVSRLFNGNPDLIQGFNTFLPAGYRIDVSDPLDPNVITVTTPSGTSVQNTNSGALPQLALAQGFGSTVSSPLPPFPTTTLQPALVPVGSGAGSRSITPIPPSAPHVPQPIPDVIQFPTHIPHASAMASVLGGMNRNPQVEKPPGEFHHAIEYLNKIKARYADDSNTYKQFLDILQNYQKEQGSGQGQRSVQDSQVYVQVQTLFKDAPDLLAEFTDFLPDSMGQGIPPQAMVGASQPWIAHNVASTDKTKRSSAPLKRKKRPNEKDSTPVPSVRSTPNKAKRSKQSHKPDTAPSPRFSPLLHPQSPPDPSIHAIPAPGQSALSFAASHNLASNMQAQKLIFWDAAKKSLERKEVYTEFLKLLALFSKDVIDVRTLIERSKAFLGDDAELLANFKELIGWDIRQDDVELGPKGSIRTGPSEALMAPPVEDGEGPSYRKLPQSEVHLACSGRDELCRSVLNDEWVSHPTWASEESGFVTHKKNAFEEALGRSEEERHEYHVTIEALTRTIAILEPVNGRLNEMSPEEKNAFRLRPDFGGPGKSIYHRIIKKVYGRESGLEIIQSLQDCPSVAVPVVLARLKQKYDDWRRSQREWSRTWREIDSKNFYKALDHQALNFKPSDKKGITTKHLISEIVKAKQEVTKSKASTRPSFARGSDGFQFDYTLDDNEVLGDALKMACFFLDRAQPQYSVPERKSIDKFLRAFMPTLCEGPLPDRSGDFMQDDDSMEPSGTSDRSGRRSVDSSTLGQPNGVAPEDLRKKLLRTAQEKADQLGSPSIGGSRAVSPLTDNPRSSKAPSRAIEGDLTPLSEGQEDDAWITETSVGSSSDNVVFSTADRERPFFANTTFYTLLRLLQLLYSRLLTCKEVGRRYATEKHAYLLANPVAVELGLDDPSGPSTILASAVEASKGRTLEDNISYKYLLEACEKVFTNELDRASFEEHMRWFFGSKAFHLFTLDKVITALVKQVQTIVSDSKCQELWALLKQNQRAEALTQQDVIRYRREAEQHVSQDDHLYRIHWERGTKRLRIQLMEETDPSVDSGETREGRWREYVNSYVLSHPTEWIPEKQPERKGPFLVRNLITQEGDAAKIEGRMRIRIGLARYRLEYDAGSEECIIQRKGIENMQERMREEDARRRARCDYL